MRVGVCNANNLDWDVFTHDLDKGIDLTYEEFRRDLESRELSEEEIQYELDRYETDERIVIFGDWLFKDGKYEPDKSGEYAAVYNSGTNIVTVEYSQYVKQCALTSPCYVMRDGSGRCGDLDNDGIYEAYSLPPEFFGMEMER